MVFGGAFEVIDSEDFATASGDFGVGEHLCAHGEPAGGEAFEAADFDDFTGGGGVRGGDEAHEREAFDAVQPALDVLDASGGVFERGGDGEFAGELLLDVGVGGAGVGWRVGWGCGGAHGQKLSAM